MPSSQDVVKELFKWFQEGARKSAGIGLEGSCLAYFVSQCYRKDPTSPYLIIASDGKAAASIKSDLDFFQNKEVFLFPAIDVLPYYQLTPHRNILSERMATLNVLLKQQKGIFVTWGSAVATHLPPKDEIQRAIVELAPQQEIDREILIEHISTWGYEKAELVFESGTFAVRGGTFDVFSPGNLRPHRLEFFGEKIESIRTFDPKTQRSIEKSDSLTLLPAREYPLNEKIGGKVAGKIYKLSDQIDIKKKLRDEALEKLREGIPPPGVGFLLPLFYDNTETIFDYLPKDTIVISEPHRLTQDIAVFKDELRSAFDHSESIERIIPPEELAIDSGAVDERRSSFRQILSTPFEPAGGEKFFRCDFKNNDELRSKIHKDHTLAPISLALKESPNRIVFAVSGEYQAGRLRNLLESHEINVQFLPDLSDINTKFSVAIGRLSAGFQSDADHIWIITEEELFGAKVRRPAVSKTSEEYFSAFSELRDGDPIVHKEYGIGIYKGLHHLNFQGIESDFLLIEYKNNDKLYLPVYRLNLVQKYVGGEQKPRIDTLGGKGWLKARTKAEKAIREMAGELINLYASRTAEKGHSFSPPDYLFKSFEAAFPYEETIDQEKTIDEVLKDMQSDKPMERLILGDVGYGKTEVAMRAAFKAAEDGKQTAFLAPTTLLAFQHYETFKKRFEGYPVTVDMISRFRSAKEIKNIIKKAAQGEVDVLIGTHRLLQPDISFKDLGLLIIDEEHRFGVKQKEKIKKLKKMVDVMSLSATPIPRTFYMSTVGVRDISVIETPPAERLAIRTYVTPYQDGIVRDAILKELGRGGQVFYVHNRVQNINEIRDHLRQLVPEAKIAVAHGQMDEDELEKTMFKFYHQECNVLLCTTIIESGIDIPTANTLIIHRADQFGIAQLYQLRGRVGRGSHQAYTYLLTPHIEDLTPDARKRLMVLQKFSDLGAGFKMATYDLEIRGAGNMLGMEQSGHMTALGYELYTDLLKEAVAELKGNPVKGTIEPELHFPIHSFIPEDYIPDSAIRLDTYRRLACTQSDEEIIDIKNEMEDRFGAVPKTAEMLLEIMAIKARARSLNIKSIRYNRKKYTYAFDPTTPVPPDVIIGLVTKSPKKYKFTPDFQLTVDEPLKTPEEVLISSKNLLQSLLVHVSSTRIL